MASVSEILGIDSYRGQGYAGGNVSVALELDAKPFQQLALLSYYKAKDEWNRDNTMRDNAAKELGKVASLDPSSYLPEQYDVLLEKKNEIIKLSENPYAFNHDKDPKAARELQNKLSEFNNLATNANANDLVYKADKSAIDLMEEGEEKNLKKEQLEINKQLYFQGGAKNKLAQGALFNGISKVSKDNYTVPLLSDLNYTVDIRNPNDTQSIEMKLTDVPKLFADAAAIGLGIYKAPKYVYDPKKSELENRNDEITQKLKYSNTNTKYLQDSVDLYNKSLFKYKELNAKLLNPNISPEEKAQIELELSKTPPQIKLIQEQVTSTNEQIKIYNEKVDFLTKQGRQGQLKKADFINAEDEDGLSIKEQVIINSIGGRALTTVYKENRQYNGDATKIEVEKLGNATQVKIKGMDIEANKKAATVAYNRAIKAATSAASKLNIGDSKDKDKKKGYIDDAANRMVKEFINQDFNLDVKAGGTSAKNLPDEVKKLYGIGDGDYFTVDDSRINVFTFDGTTKTSKGTLGTFDQMKTKAVVEYFKVDKTTDFPAFDGGGSGFTPEQIKAQEKLLQGNTPKK